MITEEKNSISTHQETLTAEEIDKIRKLLQFVEVEPLDDSLILRNKQGTARILLRKDGTVRVEGTDIFATAGKNMSLSAAKIDMN